MNQTLNVNNNKEKACKFKADLLLVNRLRYRFFSPNPFPLSSLQQKVFIGATIPTRNIYKVHTRADVGSHRESTEQHAFESRCEISLRRSAGTVLSGFPMRRFAPSR